MPFSVKWAFRTNVNTILMTQTFLEFKILSSIYHYGAKNYFITDQRCVEALHKIVWKQTFLGVLTQRSLCICFGFFLQVSNQLFTYKNWNLVEVKISRFTYALKYFFSICDIITFNFGFKKFVLEIFSFDMLKDF